MLGPNLSVTMDKNTATSIRCTSQVPTQLCLCQIRCLLQLLAGCDHQTNKVGQTVASIRGTFSPLKDFSPFIALRRTKAAWPLASFAWSNRKMILRNMQLFGALPHEKQSLQGPSSPIAEVKETIWVVVIPCSLFVRKCFVNLS